MKEVADTLERWTNLFEGEVNQEDEDYDGRNRLKGVKFEGSKELGVIEAGLDHVNLLCSRQIEDVFFETALCLGVLTPAGWGLLFMVRKGPSLLTVP